MVTIYHLNPVLCVLDNCRPCLRPFRALLHRTPHHFTTKDALDVPFTLHNCSLQTICLGKIRFFLPLEYVQTCPPQYRHATFSHVCRHCPWLIVCGLVSFGNGSSFGRLLKMSFLHLRRSTRKNIACANAIYPGALMLFMRGPMALPEICTPWYLRCTD